MFIFIHGGNVNSDTWNQEVGYCDYPKGTLLGGKVWNSTIKLLERQGYQCVAPTLKDENQYTLSDHIGQICDVIDDNVHSDIILVAHSYGGMVLSGVLSKYSDKVQRAFYIDAAVPYSGESLFDLLELAGFQISSIISGQPKAYIEKIELDKESIEKVDKVYVSCSESQFRPLTDILKERIAQEGGWQLCTIEASHLPMAKFPDRIADILSGYESY